MILEGNLENSRILVVDDDPQVAATVERCLLREKFEVEIASTGLTALESARQSLPDLILLDVMMPGLDGYDVCRQIRADEQLKHVPVIFLTAKTSEEDHIQGFKAGGDDYINKPFNIEELVLHVRAVLKRTCPPNSALDVNHARSIGVRDSKNRIGHTNATLSLKGYRLNTSTFELTLPNDIKILLTPIQFDLLFNFMSHPGEIFSPTHLLSIIWDYPPNTGSQDLVRVHIKNLRLRIEVDAANPTFIETISGYGYTVRSD